MLGLNFLPFSGVSNPHPNMFVVVDFLFIDTNIPLTAGEKDFFADKSERISGTNSSIGINPFILSRFFTAW
jgi:hypothetical protein|tara:strand:- start:1185 stop:1397 length:213 start_codon:yes stop_codon:yes gene_type:complete